jgi:hypothetical protein
VNSVSIDYIHVRLPTSTQLSILYLCYIKEKEIEQRDSELLPIFTTVRVPRYVQSSTLIDMFKLAHRLLLYLRRFSGETGISLEQQIIFFKIIIISIAEFRLLLYTRICSRITFIVYTDDLLAKIMLILMGLKAWIQFHYLN